MNAPLPKGAQILIRALAPTELLPASRLLLRTNDGLPAQELETDLRGSHVKWPELQLGAFDGNALLGVIAGRLDKRDPTLGWSDDIVLADAAQGQGLGARLLKGQIQAFNELGCTRVRGLSPRRLFGAVAFFERHGFRVIEKTVSQGLWGIDDGEPLWITELTLR